MNKFSLKKKGPIPSPKPTKPQPYDPKRVIPAKKQEGITVPPPPPKPKKDKK